MRCGLLEFVRVWCSFFFFQAEDGIRDLTVTGVQTCAFRSIVEESLCRGLGFALLQAWGERVAIVGSAVAFALAHGAVLDLPWVLVTGLGLGYLRSRTGSLYPSIALHATVNGIAVLASAYLAANGSS